MVARSRKNRVVEPALGAALSSCPNNYFWHQEAALPGAWCMFVAGGAHPHHEPPNP